jgi:hypothetical protein
LLQRKLLSTLAANVHDSIIGLQVEANKYYVSVEPPVELAAQRKFGCPVARLLHQ